MRSCRISSNGVRVCQTNNRTNKVQDLAHNGFSTENIRNYDTIQLMKYSVQQETRPYPKNKAAVPDVTWSGMGTCFLHSGSCKC